MSDRVYTQACLTPKIGGLGLRKTVEHADCAFAASWHESRATANEVWILPDGVPEGAGSQQFTSGFSTRPPTIESFNDCLEWLSPMLVASSLPFPQLTAVHRCGGPRFHLPYVHAAIFRRPRRLLH